MFESIDTTGVEEQQDRLGGGSYTVESGIYDAVIKLAYVVPAPSSKSQCIVTVMTIGDKEITERNWIFNRDGEAFYTKNGKKFFLPGFEKMNDMCLLASGYPLAEQKIENKVIKVYDPEAKGEIDKNMPVITSILGKPVTVAIIKATENKQEKGNDGAYHDTNDQREVNRFEKFFHTETKRTVVEVKSGASIGEADLFYTKWGEKNTGVTKEDFKSVTVGASQSGTGSPAKAPAQGKSLFGN